MKALDLFTGYGGITLALEGYVKPVAYCEIEEYAQKIIAYRMADGSLPRAPILGDVKNIRGSIGDCDIIYGGFPCQDISVAGNGKGLAGERSGLFYEIIRLTKEIRPTFVFLENVPAIRTRGLEQVIKEFTEIGYDCRWTCLSAASIGAPHKRERWFLLAYANGVRGRLQQESGRECEDKTDSFNNGSKELMADTDVKGLQRLDYPDLSGRGVTGRLEISPSNCKVNKSIWRADEWWTTEPDVGRVVNGTPFRVDRIKALGNGVVPLQVRTAFELLMGISNEP